MSPVLIPELFATPSRNFNLPSYAYSMAIEMVEAASPPSIRPRHFDRAVLSLFDLEAKQGDDSNRDSSPSLLFAHLFSRPKFYCVVWILIL